MRLVAFVIQLASLWLIGIGGGLGVLRLSDYQPHKIAYTLLDYPDRLPQIVAVYPDGSNARPVFGAAGPALHSVHFAPDGSWAIGAWIDPDDQFTNNVLVRLDVSAQPTITPLREFLPSERLHSARISPDGQRIAYLQADNDPSAGALYIITPDGALRHDTRISTVSQARASLAWTPDNNAVIIATPRALLRYDVATDTVTTLLDGQDVITPALSADGQAVLFGIDYEDRIHLFQMPINGGDPLRLTRGIRFDLFPVAGPNADWVYFAGFDAGYYDLYRIRTDGSQRQRLTNTTTNEVDLALLPIDASPLHSLPLAALGLLWLVGGVIIRAVT